MKRHIFLPTIFCFFLFLLIGSILPVADAVPATSDADRGAVANGNNAFAWNLYARLPKDTGNLFFSPYSISTALGMTFAGARGETARQMAKVLHFDLMGTLNAEGKSYRLSVANALWGQTGSRWEKEFLDIAGTWYGAGLKEVDYIDAGKREEARRTINRWTGMKTADKIRELIKSLVLE